MWDWQKEGRFLVKSSVTTLILLEENSLEIVQMQVNDFTFDLS